MNEGNIGSDNTRCGGTSKGAKHEWKIKHRIVREYDNHIVFSHQSVCKLCGAKKGATQI